MLMTIEDKSDHLNLGASTPSGNSTHLQDPVDLRLLAAESVICTDKDVTYSGPLMKLAGRIIITRYRLIFIVCEESRKYIDDFQIDIPLGFISKVEKFGRKKTVSMEVYGFQIHCKDLRVYRFTNDPNTSGRKTVCDAINRYAFPVSNSLPLFSFVHAAEAKRSNFDGWNVYNPEKEFQRLKVNESKVWKVVDINAKYQICDTYPRIVAIPTESYNKGTSFIKKLKDYRSRGRIPVLSWMNERTLASISRCSQPMTGLLDKKCPEDEQHLANILDANGQGSELNIYDARPIVNAKVNRAKGGGYEENYDRVTFTFLNIHNIHVVRESMKKMVSCLIPNVDEKNYFKLLDESKWLLHLQSILDGANKIVHNIQVELQSVLVHCSDGWDRTAQLTSLSMILLDPYYRTIEGFMVLIEKEWCSFGHKFAQRIGQGDDKDTDSERSPVFVQFCDCVSQIIYQHPTQFEFTDELLITMLDELYASRFGTFLFNSEKSRLLDNKCAEKTISLWTYIMENKKKYMYPLQNIEPTNREDLLPKPNTVLTVSSEYSQLRVWTNYYARSNPFLVNVYHEGIIHHSAQYVDEKRIFLDEIIAAGMNDSN